MFRKFALVAAAALALGVASLSPTAASAQGHHHGGGHHGGHHGGGWHGGHRRHYGSYGFYAPGYGGGGCLVRRVVPTPYGPRLRTINRCY